MGENSATPYPGEKNLQMNNLKICLQGEVAIVTGAGGMGTAIIKSLLRSGASVVVGNRSLEKIRKEIAKENFHQEKVSFFEVDVGDFFQVTDLINTTIKKHHKIDILINTAGILLESSILQTSVEDWDRTLQVNLDGAFYLSKAVLPYMIEQKKGKMIHFASIAGHRGSALSVHYSSSKAGMIGFIKSLAKEVGRYGINVNAISPGIIRTDMSKEKRGKNAEKYLSQIPLQRFGEPEDIVGMILLLVSDAGSYITGQIIHINGGMG